MSLCSSAAHLSSSSSSCAVSAPPLAKLSSLLTRCKRITHDAWHSFLLLSSSSSCAASAPPQAKQSSVPSHLLNEYKSHVT